MICGAIENTYLLTYINKAVVEQNCTEALNQHAQRWTRKLPFQILLLLFFILFYFLLSPPAQSRRQEN